MVTVLLALGSSACYGVSNFVGPLLARRETLFTVLFVSHLAALLVAAAAWVRPAVSRGSTRIRFEVLLGLGWLAYWVYVGGDVFAEDSKLRLIALGFGGRLAVAIAGS